MKDLAYNLNAYVSQTTLLLLVTYQDMPSHAVALAVGI
jgi:hypothetical protein